jgi:hypothetical protein
MTRARAERLLVSASRGALFKALHRVNPAALGDALDAAGVLAANHGLPPQVAADVERLAVHQVAKALGVKA